MTLLESFSKAKTVKNAGTRPSNFLEGMAITLSDTLDTWFTPHFHNSFAATPSSQIGFDIGAISIKVWMVINDAVYISLTLCYF